MKKIRKLIFKVWLWLFPKQIVKEVEEKLENALIEKSELLKKVRAFLYKEYKVGMTSKYIPRSIKERRAIVKETNRIYGKELLYHRLKFTEKLKFVKL